MTILRCKALARLLRASDLDADAYRSAQQFLESLQTSARDCLVLDLQMREMNGLTLQRGLVRTGIRLPVVIITGHDEPGMELRCLGAGAGAYLRKPLDDKALRAAIESAINAYNSSLTSVAAIRSGAIVQPPLAIGPRSNCAWLASCSI
jgi:FixJ family two-component response regulator